ncbi:MAG: Helix-turn-helix, type 11 domain protein [Verrucomicrobiales bacterium]|nr:Helix-turn-helix, type 11 domain protein [Verrucomicrobiales bacterium]
MLKIHHAVSTGSYPNSTEFAAELEVSIKSIHRDVDFMRTRMGLPIEFDSKKNGYYYTEEITGVPTLQITEGEFFALLVAEKALQQYRGTSFEKPLLAAFRKMADALPGSFTLNLAEWDESISFRTSAEPITNLPLFDSLAQAVGKRKTLRITYKKPGQRVPETRIIDPYHLANINSEWYLFAYDHLRKDLRTFVPIRIQTLELTGQTFPKPEKFSLEKRLRDSFGVHSAQGEFKVVLRFNEFVADYIREKKWHPSQQLLTLKNGSVELRLTLSSLEEVKRWVMGWGGNVKVISPPRLIQGVRESAEGILKALDAKK